MCSPMPELPEHFPIPINGNGDGPAAPSETVAVVCWCGDPTCQKHLEVR